MDLVVASLAILVCTGGAVLYLALRDNGYPPDVANDRVIPRHGEELCQALNQYYESHREYPPFLLGGENEWTNENVVVIHRGSPSPDPLLVEGIIKDYPRNVVRTHVALQQRRVDPRFDRSHGMLYNVVSTPNDHVVRNFVMYVSRKLEEYSEIPEDSPHAWEGVDLRNVIEFLKAGGRLYAAGGFLNPQSNSTSGSPTGSRNFVPEYTTMAGKLREWRFFNMYNQFGSAWVGNFGYTRGEYMGKDRKSAYLWMYGAPTEHQSHQGLDVLNAYTGELVPDGIPDAVLILYELKDGEVVSVTRAEDM